MVASCLANALRRMTPGTAQMTCYASLRRDQEARQQCPGIGISGAQSSGALAIEMSRSASPSKILSQRSEPTSFFVEEEGNTSMRRSLVEPKLQRAMMAVQASP